MNNVTLKCNSAIHKSTWSILSRLYHFKIKMNKWITECSQKLKKNENWHIKLTYNTEFLLQEKLSHELLYLGGEKAFSFWDSGQPFPIRLDRPLVWCRITVLHTFTAECPSWIWNKTYTILYPTLKILLDVMDKQDNYFYKLNPQKVLKQKERI